MDISGVTGIAFITLLASMTPGPDFAVITKNCINGSFKTGVLSALGVACASIVHVSYCLLGIALLIQRSPFVFNIIKYLGAGYLLYLGVALLLEKNKSQDNASEKKYRKELPPFYSGFLCNLLNPKATLFVLSLFTQFIDPSMTFLAKAALGSVIPSVVFIWFVFLSFLLSHSYFQSTIARYQVWIMKIMGVVVCLLAIYILFF